MTIIIIFLWLLLQGYFDLPLKRGISRSFLFAVQWATCLHLSSLYTSNISKNSRLMMYPWSVFLINSCLRQKSITWSFSFCSFISHLFWIRNIVTSYHVTSYHWLYIKVPCHNVKKQKQRTPLISVKLSYFFTIKVIWKYRFSYQYLWVKISGHACSSQPSFPLRLIVFVFFSLWISCLTPSELLISHFCILQLSISFLELFSSMFLCKTPFMHLNEKTRIW